MISSLDASSLRTSASSLTSLNGQILTPVVSSAHEDAIAVSAVGNRCAAASAALPLQTTTSDPLGLKGLSLTPEVLKTFEDAEAAVTKLTEGIKVAAQEQKAARLAIAAEKLKALKIAALFAVHTKNGKAARWVAEEAAKVARELNSLRSDGPVDPGTTATSDPGTPADVSAVIPETGPDKPATNSAGATPTAAPVQGGVSAADSDIDSLIQLARKIIALARKAVRPGSADDQAMAALQAGTGAPDISVDVVTEADLTSDNKHPATTDMTA